MKYCWFKIGLLFFIGILLLWGTKFSYSLVRYETYHWAPYFFASQVLDRKETRWEAGSQRHVIFLICDHYEPGFGEKGARRNQRWLKKFRPLAEKHRDSAGNRFQYTWFYPYDHKNERVLSDLAEMSRLGYGEVEMHWHHPPADNHTFPPMLDEAIGWFQRQGLLITSGEKEETRFGFIHGNWALDGSNAHCTVTRELEILYRAGCYADFTFPAVGNRAQPRRLNSIYYALDGEKPKSYDDGIPAAVGKKIEGRLMIFQGPSGISWTGKIEYGAVESYALPTKERIHEWLKTHIHVMGRPEWVFIKLHSHGIQSEEHILDKHLTVMLSDLKNTCNEQNLSLHYVTAREAYNIVKAAEDGLTGNPELYRNYRIPPPRVRAKPRV